MIRGVLLTLAPGVTVCALSSGKLHYKPHDLQVQRLGAQMT